MIELDRKGTAMRHKPWQQCDVCRAISTNAILARCHDVAGILYPNNAGARFNHDYYRDKHMPLIKARLGDTCKYYTVDKGLAGGAPVLPRRMYRQPSSGARRPSAHWSSSASART